MRVRRGVGILVVAVAAGIGLAACSSGPSMDELGPQFEDDADAILTKLSDSFAQDQDAIEVEADGSENIPCDDGATREFSATFPMRDGDTADNLDYFTRSVIAGFEGELEYTMSEGDDFSGTERTYRATNDDETITLEINATGEPGSDVVITGETACAST